MTDKDNIVCRICLEDSSVDMLVNPCNCNGSLSCVHEECLKTWLISKDFNLEDTKCEICHTDFVMKFRRSNRFSPMYACKKEILICLFILLLFSVLVILLAITCILVYSLIEGSSNEEEWYFSIVVLSFCAISILIVLYMIVNSVKDKCFRLQIENWKIYDQISDNYLLTERNTPKIISINGRKISSKRNSRREIDEFDYSEIKDEYFPMHYNNTSDN